MQFNNSLWRSASNGTGDHNENGLVDSSMSEPWQVLNTSRNDGESIYGTDYPSHPLDTSTWAEGPAGYQNDANNGMGGREASMGVDNESVPSNGRMSLDTKFTGWNSDRGCTPQRGGLEVSTVDHENRIA